jgi:hypothetical protein
MSLLSTVLKALLKSSEVRWVYGRSRVSSRALSCFRNTCGGNALQTHPGVFAQTKRQPNIKCWNHGAATFIPFDL